MADSSDLREHEAMWHKFCKLTGYALLAIVIVLVLMALFLL
jgi:hypothetical protein